MKTRERQSSSSQRNPRFRNSSSFSNNRALAKYSMSFRMYLMQRRQLARRLVGDDQQHDWTRHEIATTTTTVKPHGKMHILTEQAKSDIPTPMLRGRPPSGRPIPSYLNIVTHCLLLLVLSCWQLNPASALYLQQQQAQQQQQQPMIITSNSQQQQQQAAASNQVPDNGAIMQALTQFAVQQMASGGLSNGLQVTATSTPTGAISISNNNQQVALVNSQSANSQSGNNQTATATSPQIGGTMTMASPASAGSQAPAGSASSTSGQQGGGNQFVIKFLHNDSKNQLAYVSITPVNYTNLHEPRIELRYQSKYPYVSLAEGSPNNTVVAAVIVNDEDSGPNGETSLTIEQGNELGHFKLVSTSFTNTIQVNGAPLSRHLKPEYNLTIVARDHGSPPKASSSTLVIKLHASPMQNGANPALSYMVPPQPQYPSPLEPMPSLKPPVTDLMYVGTMLVVMFTAVIILIIIGCGLVQRPTQKAAKTHKGPPPTRTTSATNSRIVPPSDQCSAYCLTSGYDLSNLNIN